MTERQRIQTGFLEKQARENSRQGTTRGVQYAFMALLIAGLAFGGFQLYSFFANFKTNQYLRGVSIVLKAPELKGKQALVTVSIHNDNPFDVSQPRFRFTVTGMTDRELAAGEIRLDGTIPAADERVFRKVSLGALAGQPKRMHADLIEVSVKAPENLPKGFAVRFNEAMEKKGEEQIQALRALLKEAPALPSVHTALGMALESQERWTEAITAYQAAIADSDNYYNAHYRLGLALLHEKQEDEARKELARAAQLNPKDGAVARMIETLKTPLQ